MNNDLSIIKLIIDATIPVKIVLALLALASFMSWAIIFRKRIVISRAPRCRDRAARGPRPTRSSARTGLPRGARG